jgi:hypothetical protein
MLQWWAKRASSVRLCRLVFLRDRGKTVSENDINRVFRRTAFSGKIIAFNRRKTRGFDRKRGRFGGARGFLLSIRVLATAPVKAGRAVY